MQWSKYNYLFSFKNQYLIYNSLSNSFAELDESTYNLLSNIRKGNMIDIEDDELKQYLVKMKVLIDNELDEFNEIKYITNRRRINDKLLVLTINPTLHCNFACPYCFEENRAPIYMNDEVEDSLIENIKNNRAADKISITWFGGEPLMAFDRMISITSKIKNLNKKFTAGIITNGYLLTPEVIGQLSDLNIHNIQITIDGVKETHDSRRSLLSGEGTYDIIINNIDLLKRTQPDIKLSIRVNIDETNKNDFIQVYRYFETKKYPQTKVYPGFVEDRTGCSIDNCLSERKNKVMFIKEMHTKYGFKYSHFYPSGDRQECLVRNPYSMVIGPSGEIYKCWTDVGNPQKIIGSLDNSIRPNHKLHLRYLYGADPLNDKKCLSCFHFPNCGGGCPLLRLENEYEGKNIDTCCLMKGNMKDFLEYHYQNKIKNEI